MSAKTASEPTLLLGVSEAAELLNVSRGHVYGLIARGAMPKPIKLGDRTVFRRSEIVEWVAAGCPQREGA